MAKELIHAATRVEHNSVDVEGATHWSFSLDTVVSTDQGDAAEPGMVEEVITHYSLSVTIFSEDPFVLLGLIGDAAANLVCGYKGAGGVAKKVTFKNVQFTGGVVANAKAKDAGGNVPTHSLTGRAEWGAADTIALMIVDAADA